MSVSSQVIEWIAVLPGTIIPASSVAASVWGPTHENVLVVESPTPVMFAPAIVCASNVLVVLFATFTNCSDTIAVPVDATTNIKDQSTISVSCAEGDQGFVYEGSMEYELIVKNIESLPKINS